jgi:hypothetical protein
MAELQRHDRDGVRDSPADNHRGEMCCAHTDDVLREIINVLDREGTARPVR